MKTITSLMTLILGLLLSTNAFAARAYYLSAQDNESPLIDSIKEKGDSQYKIYVAVYKKKNASPEYVYRTVNRDEISLATDQEINGLKVGRRALIWYAQRNRYIHCQVSSLFENGMLNMFCDFMADGAPRRLEPTIHSSKCIPEIRNSLEGINQDDTMVLNRDVGPLVKGTEVRVRFLFQDGQILIDKKVNPFATYINRGPDENLNSVLVRSTDLAKSTEDVKGESEKDTEAHLQTGG